MKKIYKCRKCGHEYKQDTPPVECRVKPECKGSGFFIDLTSYGQLEARCNGLQEQITELRKDDISIKIIEIPSIETSSIPKSRIKTRIGQHKKETEDKKEGEKEVSRSNKFKEQVRFLSEEKTKLVVQNNNLESKLRELQRLQKQTHTDKIIPLQEEKERYQTSFIVSFVINVIFVLILIF
ncbi:hypothetical protein Lepto7376_1888 [[Leptolyngbya] sp. PCC 7376]|uniref:hypothetical protein n=1 Tax=[Leptolyngbya] sp. PCC 7376 TaxID=111781 RepID=UPI00029EC3CF|nr:hypothetical protein [[Leptolyngbya] sp. PCC 7376]AFY38207.1 hypothetical protein Lepto7376_1888 [[Leptolyngbya] sp. PCC 7376]